MLIGSQRHSCIALLSRHFATFRSAWLLVAARLCNKLAYRHCHRRHCSQTLAPPPSRVAADTRDLSFPAFPILLRRIFQRLNLLRRAINEGPAAATATLHNCKRVKVYCKGITTLIHTQKFLTSPCIQRIRIIITCALIARASHIACPTLVFCKRRVIAGCCTCNTGCQDIPVIATSVIHIAFAFIRIRSAALSR